VRDQADQPFGQFHQLLRGTVQAVALLKLPAHGLVNGSVPMSEHDRTPAAHEIKILPPVCVPDVAALPALEELRIAGRQGCRPHMPIHAAGNDPLRAVTQALVLLCELTVCQGHRSNRFSAT
jgi:hypothetical protein